jgi:hypothetical protein
VGIAWQGVSPVQEGVSFQLGVAGLGGPGAIGGGGAGASPAGASGVSQEVLEL